MSYSIMAKVYEQLKLYDTNHWSLRKKKSTKKKRRRRRNRKRRNKVIQSGGKN